MLMFVQAAETFHHAAGDDADVRQAVYSTANMRHRPPAKKPQGIDVGNALQIPASNCRGHLTQVSIPVMSGSVNTDSPS